MVSRPAYRNFRGIGAAHYWTIVHSVPTPWYDLRDVTSVPKSWIRMATAIPSRISGSLRTLLRSRVAQVARQRPFRDMRNGLLHWLDSSIIQRTGSHEQSSPPKF